ncbi:MAG: Uma2 family endonuclease [Cyanobacteria bacterium J06626_14]
MGISDDGPFVCPDISVTCDERDRTAQKFSRFRGLIIEVMSPGTEAYDRGGKFALYRRLETLKEYVLASSEAKTVEVFRLNEEGTWTFILYDEKSEVEFISVGVTLSIQDIFRFKTFMKT